MAPQKGAGSCLPSRFSRIFHGFWEWSLTPQAISGGSKSRQQTGAPKRRSGCRGAPLVPTRQRMGQDSIPWIGRLIPSPPLAQPCCGWAWKVTPRLFGTSGGLGELGRSLRRTAANWPCWYDERQQCLDGREFLIIGSADPGIPILKEAKHVPKPLPDTAR